MNLLVVAGLVAIGLLATIQCSAVTSFPHKRSEDPFGNGTAKTPVWWARLALASPVLAFTLGAGGLAAGPTFVILILRARPARSALRAHSIGLLPEK